MLILMAESRGAVRRDRLERSAKVLQQGRAFRLARRGKALGADPRTDHHGGVRARARDPDPAGPAVRSGGPPARRSKSSSISPASSRKWSRRRLRWCSDSDAALGLPGLACRRRRRIRCPRMRTSGTLRSLDADRCARDARLARVVWPSKPGSASSIKRDWIDLCDARASVARLLRWPRPRSVTQHQF